MVKTVAITRSSKTVWKFWTSLAPGHYTVSINGRKRGLGHYDPFEVDIVAGPDDEGPMEMRYGNSVKRERLRILPSA